MTSDGESREGRLISRDESHNSKGLLSQTHKCAQKKKPTLHIRLYLSCHSFIPHVETYSSRKLLVMCGLAFWQTQKSIHICRFGH